MNSLVELIENKRGEITTRILKINNISPDQYKILFIPKLENTDFKYFDNQIFIELKNENFREQYDLWIKALHSKLKEYTVHNELIQQFNIEIKKFIGLFMKRKKLSHAKARGFYGELLELKKQLKENNDHGKVLNGWHRPAPANHDFDYEDYSLEIKAIGRTSSAIKISSEYQLSSFGKKQLKLKVSKIDLIEKSFDDSIGKLYDEIKGSLNEVHSMLFEIKCSEDTFCKYLGPEFMPLDYKFYEIEHSYYNVDQKEFPRISNDNVESGISNVKYELDLSVIEDFKILD